MTTTTASETPQVRAPAAGARNSSRTAGGAGVLSVVAMVAAFLVLPADPGGTTPRDVADRYAGGSEGYLRAAWLETWSVGLLLVLVAGLVLRIRRRPGGELAAAVVAVGGTVLATCQLLGYSAIAVLALGTAARGDAATTMAFYDASAVFFAVSCVGLALAALATGQVLLRGPERRLLLGAISVVAGLGGVVGASLWSPDGAMSPHGDLSFLVILVQLVWALALSLWLVRADPATDEVSG